MRVAPIINLTAKEKAQLEAAAKARSSSLRVQERARIVLLAAEGEENRAIAAKLGQDVMKVGRWRRRYAEGGMKAIVKDKTRPGRIPPVPKPLRAEIIRRTVEEEPLGATHWSRSLMAAQVGVSASSVGRIWASAGLKPHRVKSFKLSNDPHFEEKLDDIIGLYLNPPEHALVLSCDEKSQIQALDRTQPGLPLKKGRCQTFTHDYKRHGTTTLFAALNVFDGSILGTCMPKHRHQEWIKFLKLIAATAPPEKEVHLICDNYATHKHPKVQAWQKRNPRFHFHFTPTSASWLNQVERFFRELTVKRLRRGVFHSVDDLVAAVHTYLEVHNTNPQPFAWTAKAPDILEKVKRGRQKLNNIQSA
jgi:transposase